MPKNFTLFKILSIGMPLFIALQGEWAVGSPNEPTEDCVYKFLSDLVVSDAHSDIEMRKATQLIDLRKAGILYPETLSVEALSISPTIPTANWCSPTPLSAGLVDPLLECARSLNAFNDYKILSDLRSKNLSSAELLIVGQNALRSVEKETVLLECQRNFLKHYIGEAYEHPVELLPVKDLALPKFKMNSGDTKIDAAFQYTENTWERLLKQPKPARGGSLLPAPYPILVPAGRFQEAYYWDSYFGMKGLLATGRLEIAQMQVENFLSSVRMYGFVPNGGRDYFLSRSQPPFLSSMVREVYDASIQKNPEQKDRLKRWLKERAYPLIKLDYVRFWMDPQKRFNVKTGLNHHWDDINLPRPERHSADNEVALGKEYRDVRAGAESGLDFTEVFENQATHIAGPLLNSMLYKTEKDLSWIAHQLGMNAERDQFNTAARNRKRAISKFLWNSPKGRFEAYHLGTNRRVNILSSETFVPLFVGAASRIQAQSVRNGTLPILEKPGGLMATELVSSIHQWDGNNGWAPLQVMAIAGLNRYGFKADAVRIATKWVNAIAQTYADGGSMYERLNVETVKKPALDSNKYPTQEGFLWTNGSFNWAAIEILKYPIADL
ncbi:MAG: trehalase family glycosidase [Bdellovibrionia bacterium]